MSEQRFLQFKEYLYEELSNSDRQTKANFYICDSFYDFFIGAFEDIIYPDFNVYPDDKEEYNLLRGAGYWREAGWWISRNKINKTKDAEHNALLSIIKNIRRDQTAEITSMRGQSYMLFKDDELKKKAAENEIKVFSNRPTGSEDNIPRLMVSQISPKTFLILSLKDAKEVEFEPIKFRYSFGIPRCVFPSYAGIGEIWFFNETGLEFSRINIIDLFNSNESNIDLVGNKFTKSYLKSLRIKFFQEDNFLFKVSVGEEAGAGRLREQWSSFSAKIDLKNNEWFNLKGSSSLESFK